MCYATPAFEVVTTKGMKYFFIERPRAAVVIAATPRLGSRKAVVSDTALLPWWTRILCLLYLLVCDKPVRLWSGKPRGTSSVLP